MKKGEARRQAILERLADHVLAHGLQGASLRPLAAAAGTSDRMLLHYFADKEELLSATLSLIAQRLITMLEGAQAAPLPFQRLVPQLAAMLNDPQVRPYMRLWLELVAFAGAEDEPFRAVGRRIAQTLQSWIAAALHVEREDDRAPLAALTLTLIEGLVLLDALGDEATPRAALAGLALGAEPDQEQ
jgi:AcrR family transcriptional regulator